MGLPELWVGFWLPYLRSGIMNSLSMKYAYATGNKFLGPGGLEGLVIELLVAMAMHPVQVAHLHYLALPYSVATHTGFRSTKDALFQLMRLGPSNLFVGLPQSILYSLAFPFVRVAISRIHNTIHRTRLPKVVLRFIPTVEPLIALLMAPLGALKNQAMAQTPFLRPHVEHFSYSPILHAQELWTRHGIRGFYSGLRWGVFAATARNSIWTIISSITNISYLQSHPSSLKTSLILFVISLTYFGAATSPRITVPSVPNLEAETGTTTPLNLG